jgi:hypothetical protein
VRKKRKASFEVPVSCLVGCDTDSTGKVTFITGISFRIEQLKNNGLLFKKIVKL